LSRDVLDEEVDVDEGRVVTVDARDLAGLLVAEDFVVAVVTAGAKARVDEGAAPVGDPDPLEVGPTTLEVER
jgi:hypothetical protein